MKIEGLEDEPGRKGWTKTRAFGHVAYARRDIYGLDDKGRPMEVLFLAMRIGNIPLGVPFVRHDGPWAMVDVLEEATLAHFESG